jgi:hypothetical protein
MSIHDMLWHACTIAIIPVAIWQLYAGATACIAELNAQLTRPVDESEDSPDA